MKKLNAFAWYGGKYSHLVWLLPLLDTPCNHFVDVFGGSAAVILNRPPAPVETYNDLDHGVVNFYRCLRKYPEQLQRAIACTPYSREEFVEAYNGMKDYDPHAADQASISEHIEYARLFFICARTAFAGGGREIKGRNWSYDHDRSSRGMSSSVSRWHACVDRLPEISDRLLRVQIENDNAINLIKRLDRPGTLFYCDPPYLHETRDGRRDRYMCEMNNDEHVQLADTLNAAKGKVAISYYDCDLLYDLYPEEKWFRHFSTAKKVRAGRRKAQELLMTNYEI